MHAPDPLNWVYLFYTLSAAILTYLNVSVTVRRRQSNILLILSRVGTAILTIGTFFDNLRTFLASFPSAMYPEAVTSAPNVTAANAAWKEINYSGANFQSGVFWFCGFNHIVLVAISCFTCVQFISVYKNMPCLGGDRGLLRKMFVVSSVLVFALFAFQVFAFISGPASGPLKLEEPRDGILTVTAANEAPAMGLLSVFMYTFGMFFVGLAAICREGAGLRCKNILFTVAVFLGLFFNAAFGATPGFPSVLGNFGEQLLFAVVLWFDFSHNNGEVGDNEVYLEV
jgi:hypothetical protein